MNRLDKGLLVRVDREHNRLWIMGTRIHHGAVGLALTAIGLALALHDRRDFREWLRR